MRRGRIVYIALACLLADCAFAQTAPQRSEELCEVLKQFSVEKGLEFKPSVTYPQNPQDAMLAQAEAIKKVLDQMAKMNERFAPFANRMVEVMQAGLSEALAAEGTAAAPPGPPPKVETAGVGFPGSCTLAIDKGGTLAVTYDESTLYVALGMAPGTAGDASAVWLRLSALDNLAHVALGTKPQTVFEEQIKISKRLPYNADKDDLSGKAQRATVVTATRDGWLILLASASVKDIDKMKRDQKREASGEIATWRKVLSRSLLAFAAGAKGYGDAYRSYHQNPRQQSQYTSCYTNFLGSTADTHCY